MNPQQLEVARNQHVVKQTADETLQLILAEIVRAGLAGDEVRWQALGRELQDRFAQTVQIAWLQATHATCAVIADDDEEQVKLQHLSLETSKGYREFLVPVIRGNRKVAEARGKLREAEVIRREQMGGKEGIDGEGDQDHG